MAQRSKGPGSIGAGATFLITTGTASTLLSKTLLNLKVPTGRPGAKDKLFRKPWTVTLFMFLGMALVPGMWFLGAAVAELLALLARVLRRGGAGPDSGSGHEPLLTPSQRQGSRDLEQSASTQPQQQQQQQQPPHRALAFAELLRQCSLVLVPAVFDIAATGTHKVGLMWLQVSVYQMLRASQLVFTALYTVTWLHRRLTRWHGAGIALTIIGICLVGLAGILGHKEAAPAEVPFHRMLAGMGITVASEAIHAAQLVAEDHYINDLSLHPVTVVGLEGLLGSAVMLAAVLPAAQLLPGPAGKGLHEDSWETLRMLRASPELRLAAAAYITVGGLFNIAGMLMTDSVGAVFRTIVEMLRMLAVWVINLAIYYITDGSGDHRFGEPWTRSSWLQALGFACTVAGALVYAHGKALQEKQWAAGAASAAGSDDGQPQVEGQGT